MRKAIAAARYDFSLFVFRHVYTKFYKEMEMQTNMIFTPTPENPDNTPDHLKANLTTTIAKVVRESYPSDKYRSRKLDFETLTQLLM